MVGEDVQGILHCSKCLLGRNSTLGFGEDSREQRPFEMLFGPPRLFQLQFTCYFVKLPSYFLPFFPPLLSKFDILIRCFNLKKKKFIRRSHITMATVQFQYMQVTSTARPPLRPHYIRERG